MKNELYILHHLGLGDHIICNGLIRCLLKHVDEITLFAKSHNCDNVKRMFEDQKENLSLISLKNDQEIFNYIKEKEIKNCLIIGHHHLQKFLNRGYTWDESFYKQLDIPFIERWNSFYVKRNYTDETNLKDKLNIKKSYALVHSTDSTNTDRINYNMINKNLQLVKVIISKSIFDYIDIINDASEIHCVDSSFKFLVDSYKLEFPLYYHRNFKFRNSSSLRHKSQNNWIEI